MPIPSGVARIVIQGHLGNGEIFETGLWSVGHAPISDASAADYATNFGVDFTTTANPGLRGLLTNQGGYDKVTVYSYPNGGPTAQFIGEAAMPSPPGGNGGGNNPLQVCLVATLLTGQAGRRNRGRMYLPATGAVVAGGRFDNSQVDSALNALGSFIQQWNEGRGDVFGNLGVVSTVGSTARVISSIRADNLPDIQRRRANKMASTHTVTIPTT